MRFELRTTNNEAEYEALRFEFRATNNEAEYEALLVGIRLAKSLEVRRLKACSDSQLIAK